MSSRGRVALAAAGLLLVALVAQQLLLPGIAERRLRDRLEGDGTVERVEVSAFPALKVLGDRADRVVVRMSESRAQPGRLADLVASSERTGELDARVGRLRVLLLRLRDARLAKDGRRLHGEATVTDADLRAALPAGFDVRPVAAGGGALVFEGTAEVLGQRFRGRFVVAARDGRVILAPDVPLGGLLTLTLFEDPRIDVTDVGGHRRAAGFTLTADARLRDPD